MYQMSAISTAATMTELAVAAAKTRAKGRDHSRMKGQSRRGGVSVCGQGA